LEVVGTEVEAVPSPCGERSLRQWCCWEVQLSSARSLEAVGKHMARAGSGSGSREMDQTDGGPDAGSSAEVGGAS